MAKIEQLKLPKEVIDFKADYEIYGTTPEKEMEYVPPEAISKESIKKIKSINQERGHRLVALFTKNEKMAA